MSKTGTQICELCRTCIMTQGFQMSVLVDQNPKISPFHNKEHFIVPWMYFVKRPRFSNISGMAGMKTPGLVEPRTNDALRSTTDGRRALWSPVPAEVRPAAHTQPVRGGETRRDGIKVSVLSILGVFGVGSSYRFCEDRELGQKLKTQLDLFGK